MDNKNDIKDDEVSKHNCEIRPLLSNYPTIKSLLIAVFALITPLTMLIMYVVNDTANDIKREIELKLFSITEKTKQNELRILRMENSSLKYEEKSGQIYDLLKDIKTDLKYNFVTNAKFDEMLKKKVDVDRINKQYLNK